MRTMKHLVSAAIVAFIGTSAAAAQQPSATQAEAAGRWAPWIGCWQLAEESVEDGARLLDDLTTGGSGRTTSARGALVCVAPGSDGNSGTITTIVNDKPVLTEAMVADATQRSVTDAGCRGWQKAEWSALGARMFARAEIACGEQPQRTVSGLAAVVAGPVWLDIQLIESDGRKSLRVRRYRRAANQQQAAIQLSVGREQATTPLSTKLSIPEIKEAAGKVPTEVLQAAVLELGDGGYDLKAKQLVDLDVAGVPDSVIDLMVAMSYPQRFVVERAVGGGGGGGGFATPWDVSEDMWPYLAMWPYGGMFPYYGDPFGASSFYAPLYSTYYSPFGYRNWGYMDPTYYQYYGNPGLVVLEPTPGGGIVAEPTGEGRVVDGSGYTRIRRVEPATPARASEGGWGTTAASPASSGSGNGGVSSGGYSSGGSEGGGGGRVAVPRPPGGN